MGAARGRPGGGISCLVVGRPGMGALPRPTARPCSVRPGPATRWLWVRGVSVWRPVTYPTARALASWLCALWGRHENAQGGALLLGCGASGVGRSPMPDRPSLGRVVGAHYPLAVGAPCGHGGPACLGTFSRAAVPRVWRALPGLAAPSGRRCLAPVRVPWLWPAACLSGVPRGPVLVRRASSGPVALGATVGFPVAVVPSPTPVAPGFTGWLRGARGGRLRTGLIVPAAGLCRGTGAGLVPRRTRSGPRDEVVPGGSLRLRSWAASAAVVWRVWTRSLTRPVSGTLCLSTGDWAGAPGLLRVNADTSPFGSEDATPGSRACVPVPGAFWCASPFLWPFCPSSLLGPLRAGVAPACAVFFFYLFFLSPRLSSGAPAVCDVFCFPAWVPLALAPFVFSCPPPLFFCLLPFFPLRSPPSCAPRPSSCWRWRFRVFGRGCPGPWRCVVCPPLFFVGSPPPSRLPLCVRARCCPPLCLVLCVSLGVVLCLPCPLPSVRCCAALWWSGALPWCCLFVLCRFWRPPCWCVPVCCSVFCGVLRCGVARAAGCLVCRAAARCAVFFCVLSCCVAAPPVRSRVVMCWRACVVRLCCALLCCFALACASGRLPPPTPPWCARCALCCLVSPCCAALPSGVLRCRVAVFRAACLGVVSRLALLWAAPRCAVLVVPLSRLLLCAVPRPWSCRPATLFALWFAVWFCCVSPCVVVCCFPGCCPAPRCSALCCAVVCWAVWCRSFGVAACCVVPSGTVCRPGVLRFCGAVFCGVSPRPVLCAVCVLPWCGGACCCSLLCVVLWLFWGVLLCVPCPFRSVRCCAALCWCVCFVLFVWPALFLAPGAVVHCCVLCCCLWCAVAHCWVWLSAVVFWWPVSVPVSLSGCVARFPVVGVVCCGALLPGAMFCGALLSCGAVQSCCAVFLRSCVCLLFLFSLKNRCKARKNGFPLRFLFCFFLKKK